MAENLRITTPVTVSGDRSGNIKGANAPTPIGNIDPSQVLNKENAAQAQDRNANMQWNNNSVFQSFVNKLKAAPPVSQTLGKLLNGVTSELNTTSVASPAGQIMSELIESTVMTEEQMLENLLFQSSNSTKFNTELFDLFKVLAKNGKSERLNQCIGRFLKAYDGYFNANQTMSTVAKQLQKLLDYIPKSYRVPIEEAINELDMSQTNDSTIQHNLGVLKDNVLPTLGKYFATFNDFGEGRNKLSLIMHDISRLNVSTADELGARFNELIEYMKYEMNVPASELKTIEQMFSNAMESAAKGNENKLIDTLAKMLNSDATRGLSATGQGMIRETMQTLLLDYNVYMPFAHYFLPVSYKDKQLMTDIWVEKDGDGTSAEQKRKIYINFDISDMGSFQAIIELAGYNVDCKLHLPQDLKKELSKINGDVEQIFKSVGFESAKITTVAHPIDIKAQIIKRIGERGDSIDVTI